MNNRERFGLLPPVSSRTPNGDGNPRPVSPEETPRDVSTPAPVRTSITVLKTIHYQSNQGEPVTVEGRYSNRIQNEEEPYSRRIKVGSEWQKLDVGWVETPGIICLKNIIDRQQVVPTAEVKAQLQAKIVQIGIYVPIDVSLKREEVTPVLHIPPGETQDLRFVDISKIYLRCLNELTTNCQITVFPE